MVWTRRLDTYYSGTDAVFRCDNGILLYLFQRFILTFTDEILCLKLASKQYKNMKAECNP